MVRWFNSVAISLIEWTDSTTSTICPEFLMTARNCVPPPHALALRSSTVPCFLFWNFSELMAIKAPELRTRRASLSYRRRRPMSQRTNILVELCDLSPSYTSSIYLSVSCILYLYVFIYSQASIMYVLQYVMYS